MITALQVGLREIVFFVFCLVRRSTEFCVAMAELGTTPSEETRQRAELAKQYIENMYSNKSKALNDRQHRYAPLVSG